MRLTKLAAPLFATLLAATAAHAQCPAAPTNLTVGGPCANLVQWTGVSGASTYQILRSSTNQLADATVIATASGFSSVALVPAVASGTTVYYWVRAVASPFVNCPGGTGPATGPIQATGPALPAPTLVGVEKGCGTFTVTWNPVPGATGYRVGWAEVLPGRRSATEDVPATSTSHTMTPPANVLDYFRVTVTALGECGAGGTATETGVRFDRPLQEDGAFAAVVEVIDCTTLRIGWQRYGIFEARVTRRVTGMPDTVVLDWFVPGSTPNLYTIETVQPNVGYTYITQTRNACGVGPTYSTIVYSEPARIPALPVTRAAAGRTVTLAPAVSPNLVGYTYQWYRGADVPGSTIVPVVDNARFSGATTPRLTISHLRPEDADFYFVAGTRSDCFTTGGLAPLLVTVACPADFDGSGARTIDDIFIFLNTWFAGCP